eukprot:gnl/Chilomastix_caulleri/7681.p1 GENE.gnl/Chilomastix_caulleri/7681~~gnl/Chilomastix_caulleri/7681.p1  ORF type:complete len:59 (-),score=2.20 gnl/Chilomastix_caulleri/7681:7-183(-)
MKTFLIPIVLRILRISASLIPAAVPLRTTDARTQASESVFSIAFINDWPSMVGNLFAN